MDHNPAAPPPPPLPTAPPPPVADPFAPSLPAAPPTPQPIATQPAPGQIPAHLYDARSFNRPLNQRRSALGRLMVGGLVVIVILAIGAAVVAGLLLITEQDLPEVTAEPSYRSSTFRETVSSTNAGDSYISVVSADTVDRMVRVSFDRDDYVGWTGSDTHWVSIDDPAERIENGAVDNQVHQDLLDIANGLTIDDVIPVGARPYTDVISVDGATILGEEVKRYKTQVDLAKLELRNPPAYEQFTEFWGGEVDESAPANTPVNVTVWANDEGVVYQVESKSDFESSFYRLTFVEVSNTEPFTPVFPDEQP